MVEIIVPEWLVWLVIDLMVIQIVLSVALFYVRIELAKAERGLHKKLMELALKGANPLHQVDLRSQDQKTADMRATLDNVHKHWAGREHG